MWTGWGFLARTPDLEHEQWHDWWQSATKIPCGRKRWVQNRAGRSKIKPSSKNKLGAINEGISIWKQKLRSSGEGLDDGCDVLWDELWGSSVSGATRWLDPHRISHSWGSVREHLPLPDILLTSTCPRISSLEPFPARERTTSVFIVDKEQ